MNPKLAWLPMPLLLACVHLAQAQQPDNIPAIGSLHPPSVARKALPTIGWLWFGASPAGSLPSLENGLIEGLRGLGYVEGKTVKLEQRFAQGRPEQLVALARDLAHNNVDVILALGGDVTNAVKKATSTIPVVMGVSEDPVRASLVQSLARPGGNVTGVTFLSDDLAGKRLELLKEINPRLARVAVLSNPAHSTTSSK